MASGDYQKQGMDSEDTRINYTETNLASRLDESTPPEKVFAGALTPFIH